MDGDVRRLTHDRVNLYKSIKLKANILSPKYRRAITNIGLLAISGIGPRQFIKALPTLLKETLNIDLFGFVWFDSNQYITDSYFDSNIFFSHKDFMCSIKKNTTNGIVSTNQVFEKDTFLSALNDICCPETFTDKYEMFLKYPVKHGNKLFGTLLYVQKASSSDFIMDETSILTAVSQLVRLSFLVPKLKELPAKRAYETGLITLDNQLNISFINLIAHFQLSEIDQQMGNHDGDISLLISRVFQSGIDNAIKLGEYVERKNSSWSKFYIKYQYNQELKSIAISIKELKPYPSIVAIKLARENLSPAQLMITWLLLTGCVRKEISKKMEISESTVAEHMKEVFLYFNVNSTNSLILKVYR